MSDSPEVAVVGGTEAEGQALAEYLKNLIDAVKTLTSELEAAQETKLEAARRIEADNRDQPLARDTALNIAQKHCAQETLRGVLLFLLKIEMPRELTAPLLHLHAGLDDSIEGRSNDLLKPLRLKARKSTKPIHEARQWSAAAAAVTILIDYCEWKLDVALQAAAMATGASETQIGNFRKELKSGRASAEAVANYTKTMESIRANSTHLSPQQLAGKAFRLLTLVRDLSEPKKSVITPG